MKSSLSEVKFLFLTVSAIFLLMAIHYFQPQLSYIYNPGDYAGIHTLLEFISISISAAIFIYGLKSFKITRSSRMLLISFTFLIVAAMDLLHTLSSIGMPHFITNSSAAKAAWFWVIARGAESVLLLILIIFPNRKAGRDFRIPVIVTAIMLIVFMAITVFYYQNSQPSFVIEGPSTTFPKNLIEYGFSFLKFLAIIILLYQYFLEKSSAKLSLALAFVFLLFSELIIMTYQNVYGIDNLTGHLFKVLGYYYLLKSFYLIEDSSELAKLYMLISEQPGFIFQLEVRGNECVCTFCEGSLLTRIGRSSKGMFSHTSLGLFKILGHSVEEYCMSPGNVKEQRMFERNYMDKMLLITVKRLPISEGTRKIIGSVEEIRRGQ